MAQSDPQTLGAWFDKLKNEDGKDTSKLEKMFFDQEWTRDTPLIDIAGLGKGFIVSLFQKHPIPAAFLTELIKLLNVHWSSGT